jgi:hypothetical protein
MNLKEHEEKVLAFVNRIDEPELKGNLGELLYAVSELGLVDNINSISTSQAIFIWKAVEAVRAKQFPKNLGM